MKKVIATIFIAALLMSAQGALASGIASFDQQIAVGDKGVLTVRETVTVDFTEQHHGIYRDIPVNYKTDAGNPFNLRVKVVSVTDGSGVGINYSTSRNGDDLRVKIGDAASYVGGRQVYVITYSVSRALLFLSDQDQLYWNVIAGPWADLGIPKATTASVVLPGGTVAKTACFAVFGSKVEGGCTKTIENDTALFAVNGTPLTIVVGWPKGTVAPPTASDSFREWLADNGVVFWPVIVFIVMFMLWFKKGRDPKPQGPLVVQYDPPAGANPAEVGVLFDQRTNAQEITATIIHLAVKGYLDISETAEKNFFGSKPSYSFELKKSASVGGTLVDYERQILDGMFGAGAAAGAKVGLSELQTTFYKVAIAARKQMSDAAVKRGWFAKNPTAVRAFYVGAGIAYGAILFWLAPKSLNGPVAVISLLAPAVIVMVFGYFMPARTVSGTAAYAHALGFKEYLSKAEKYRLQWEEKENIFQAFLPYAMVYGVVDKWAKAFEGIEMQPPSWYHGGAMNGWSPLIFAHTLTTATSSIGHALSVAPSSKGGGGFGGGGFGGGGFGGGGGGSW